MYDLIREYLRIKMGFVVKSQREIFHHLYHSNKSNNASLFRLKRHIYPVITLFSLHLRP